MSLQANLFFLMSILILRVNNNEILDCPLNRWPMIMSHDAGTGYLNKLYRWGKTQQGSIYDQLNNGVRGLDIRTKEKNGKVLMAHDIIEINVEVSQVFNEVLKWTSENKDDQEIVIIMISHQMGENVEKLTKNILQNMNIHYIDRCEDLVGMTVRKVLDLSKGQNTIAVFDCQNQNWPQGLSCASSPLDICWKGYKGHDTKFQNLTNYIINTSHHLPYANLWQNQAIWQSDAQSIASQEVLDILSSIINEEQWSQLNQYVLDNLTLTQSLRYVNFLLLNNVNNHGKQILAALRINLQYYCFS